MKKSILFSLLIIFSSLFTPVAGQIFNPISNSTHPTGKLPETFKKQYLKYTADTVWAMDSTYYYRVINGENVNTSRLYILDKDIRGRSVSTRFDNYNINNDEWKYSTLDSIKYNNEDNPDFYSLSIWDDYLNKWILSYRFVFDRENNYSESFQIIWNHDTHAYIDGTKNVVRYNDEGKVLEYYIYHCDSTINWENKEKTIYTYDIYGMDSIMEHFFWEATKGEWIKDRRYEGSYNPETKEFVSVENFLNVNTGEWFKSDKFTYKNYRYTNYQYLYDTLTVEKWMQDYDFWLKNEMYVHTWDYSPNIYLKTEVHKRYSAADSSWVNQSKSEYGYEGDNFQYMKTFFWNGVDNDWALTYQRLHYYGDNYDSIITQQNNSSSGNFENELKYVTEFDCHGNRKGYYKYDSRDGTTWDLDSYSLYYWSFFGYEGISNQKTGSLIISPNPSTGKIHISGISPSANGFSIEVIDISGKVVGKFHTKGVLDLSAYPKGMYILRIKNGNDVFVNKVNLLR
jgi:hypothetical protein